MPPRRHFHAADTENVIEISRHVVTDFAAPCRVFASCYARYYVHTVHALPQHKYRVMQQCLQRMPCHVRLNIDARYAQAY